MSLQEARQELTHNVVDLGQQLSLYEVRNYPPRDLPEPVPFNTEPLAVLLGEKVEGAERDVYLKAMGSIATLRVGVAADAPFDVRWVGLYARNDETLAAAFGFNRGFILEQHGCNPAHGSDISIRLFAEMFGRVDGMLLSQEILLLDTQIVGDPNPELDTGELTTEQAIAANTLVTVARGILSSVSEEGVQ